MRSGDTAHGLFLDLGSTGNVTGIKESATGEANCFLDCMLINRKLVLDFIECYQNLGYIDIMDILSTNLSQIQVDSWCYTGYEHAVDNAEDYMHVSLDCCGRRYRRMLFAEDRPVLTKTQDSPPAQVSARGQREEFTGGGQLYSGGDGGEFHSVPKRPDRQGRSGAQLCADAALHHWAGRCGGECDLR